MKILTRSAQLERDAFDTRVKQGLQCSCATCKCQKIACTCMASLSCQFCWHPGNPLNQMSEKHWEEIDADLWADAMLDGHGFLPSHPNMPCTNIFIPQPTDPVDCATTEEKPAEKKIDYSKITKGLCG